MGIRKVVGIGAVTAGSALVALAPSLAGASGTAVSPNSSATTAIVPTVPASIVPTTTHVSLPFTGINVSEVAGLGVVLVGAGGALLLIRRRSVA